MHGPTSAAGDDLMTWHNLPCSPTLHAFAGACPHGWVELHLEQYRAVSYGRAWGVSSDDLEIIFEWLDWGDGIEDDEVLCLPAGAVVIAQVDNIPRCDACKSVGGGAIGKRCARDGCPGGVMQSYPGVLFLWGEGEKPVYWIGEGAPDYTGQQAAPAEAPGDMWAQIIARAEQHGVRPSLIERMRQRRQQGIENYGRPLAPHNGRDAVRDVMEESLDRLAFLEQLAEERPELQPVVGESQSDDLVLLTFLDQLVAAERSR